MRMRLDEETLLELIEGTLDRDRAAQVQAQLRRHPEIRAVVDSARRDRDALCALPDVELPRDFVAEIEPMLARPMLMDPSERSSAVRPGEFRRQHRRTIRRVRWSRLAMVAVLGLSLLAGVWAATVAVINRPTEESTLPVAVHGTGDPGGHGLRAENLAGSAPMIPEGGQVHHYMPIWPAQRNQSRLAGISPHGSRDDDSAESSQSDTQSVVAEFALLIQRADPTVAEELLAYTLTDLHDQTALVRNFSYEEAQLMESQWRLAQGQTTTARSPASVVSAGQSGRATSNIRELARHVRQQWQSQSDPSGSDVAPSSQVQSRLITGAQKYSPSLEQQLELSSRGASHALIVPGDQLSNLLERLAMREGLVTALSMLPQRRPALDIGDNSHVAPGTIGTGDTLALWLNQGTQIRHAVQRLTQSRPGTHVIVPVIIADPSK